MAIKFKNGNIDDFNHYLNRLIEDIEDSDDMYEGIIKEERINGDIESFYIKLERSKDSNANTKTWQIL